MKDGRPNISKGQWALTLHFGNRRATITYPPQMPQSLRDWFKPFQKTSHIYRLYLHYCYLLGVLPKKNRLPPHKPLSQRGFKEAGGAVQTGAVYEQIRHRDFLTTCMRDRERLQGEMDKLIAYRTKLQNKIRRASPAEKVDYSQIKWTSEISEIAVFHLIWRKVMVVRVRSNWVIKSSNVGNQTLL